MKHLFIRPESKVKHNLGRSETVVLYDTTLDALVVLFQLLREQYSYTAENFTFDWSDKSVFKIVVFNDHDYYRWLDIVNKGVYHITVDVDKPGLAIDGTNNAHAFSREYLEDLGYVEVFEPLTKLFNIEIVHAPTESLLEEPYIPLVEIVDYGDTYDLPIGGSFRPGSIFARFFKFLSDLSNKADEETIGKTRKPFVVFESHLGGNIAIYKSLSTNREVDVAFFNRYGELVNVFSFQDGCPHVFGINGLTIEDLISIGTWRILHLNNAIHADENIEAVRHLNSAVDSLNQRTMKRVESLLAKDNVPLND